MGGIERVFPWRDGMGLFSHRLVGGFVLVGRRMRFLDAQEVVAYVINERNVWISFGFWLISNLHFIFHNSRR
jgi:hypothetical protein